MLLEILVIVAFVGVVIGIRMHKKKVVKAVYEEPSQPVAPPKQEPELVKPASKPKAKPKSTGSKAPKSGSKKAPARKGRGKKPDMKVIK